MKKCTLVVVALIIVFLLAKNAQAQTLYPNPSNADVVTINNTTDKAISLCISNLIGREILKENKIAAKDKFILEIHNELFPSGIYIYKITGVGINQTGRLIVN